MPENATRGISPLQETKRTMQDMMNLLMLLCAIAASLAFGMLSALALCRGAFAAFRFHASSVANRELSKVSAAS